MWGSLWPATLTKKWLLLRTQNWAWTKPRFKQPPCGFPLKWISSCFAQPSSQPPDETNTPPPPALSFRAEARAAASCSLSAFSRSRSRQTSYVGFAYASERVTTDLVFPESAKSRSSGSELEGGPCDLGSLTGEQHSTCRRRGLERAEAPRPK